jgi:FAD/FMN-containing dehydrogenase
MSRMVDQLRKSLSHQYPGRSHLFFGHLGDGNLHLISGPYTEQTDLHAVETLVYECVGAHRGSISAEHGVGVIKKDYLRHTRSTEEVRVMAALKQLFDPKQILNAGRMFEAAG